MDEMRNRAQRRAEMDLRRLRDSAARMNAPEGEPQSWVELASIIEDERIQVRVGNLDPDRVASFRAMYEERAPLPPVELYREGSVYYLSDGFHRVAAARLAGLSSINAMVRRGGFDEAYVNAETANLSHGLNLTSEDKYNILMRRLARGFYGESMPTKRELGIEYGVSHTTIGRWLDQSHKPRGTDAPLAEAAPVIAKIDKQRSGTKQANRNRGRTDRQRRQSIVRNLREIARLFEELGEDDNAENYHEAAEYWAEGWGLK